MLAGVPLLYYCKQNKYFTFNEPLAQRLRSRWDMRSWTDQISVFISLSSLSLSSGAAGLETFLRAISVWAGGGDRLQFTGISFRDPPCKKWLPPSSQAPVKYLQTRTEISWVWLGLTGQNRSRVSLSSGACLELYQTWVLSTTFFPPNDSPEINRCGAACESSGWGGCVLITKLNSSNWTDMR